MTGLTQQVLALMMVMLIGFSAFAPPVSAATGPNDVYQQSAGEDAIEQCIENVDGWAVIAPVYGAYQCIDGAFQPSEYDSSSELENEAYNNMISVKDTAETRHNDWQNWDELSQTSALQQAEKPLIEAHYAGDSEGSARSDAQTALRDYYSAQLSTEYNTHNQVFERAVSVGSNTAEADNVDTLVGVYYQYYNGGSVRDDRAFNMTGNTSLIYSNVTLPNGDTQEVVAGFENLADNESVVGIMYNGTEYDNTTLDRGYYAADNGSYNTIATTTNGESVGNLEVRDPYSDSTEWVNWSSQHSSRVSAINSEYNDSQGELVTMAEDLYSTHETGTIDPSEYVSAATLTEQYASESGHYSYASALATTNGMRTDLQSAQTISYNGSEYEGQILVGGQGQPLADDTGAAYFSSESDSVLNWTQPENNTTGTATVTLSTASNVTVESVPDVPSDAVNISDGGTTVELLEKPMLKYLEDREFVLFEINDSTGTNQTVVMYTSQDKADEGIPTGLQTGQNYSASDFADGSVMMAYQQGDRAAVKTIDSGTFSVENATNAATGEQMEYIEYDDANQRTFNSTNLKEELNQTERIQQALEQRDDVNPAGAGGDSVKNTLFAALGGFTIAFGIMFLLVVLYLVGRITSVA